MIKADASHTDSCMMAEDTFSPWWRRVVAELIDLVIVYVISNLLLLIIGESPGQAAPEARYITLDLAAIVYYPMLVWRTGGQTIGKILLRIRVVREDGSRMGLAHAAWREAMVKFILLRLLFAIPILGSTVGGFVVLADALWPLWDRENRALHDMLVRTRVVYAMETRNSQANLPPEEDSAAAA